MKNNKQNIRSKSTDSFLFVFCFLKKIQRIPANLFRAQILIMFFVNVLKKKLKKKN